jgi:arylsulfatase A-like enzyme
MPTQSNTRPNIVVIICDDIGFGDLSCNGSTMIKTPNLDLVARRGARLTSMYSGGPTCTPARAALMTGRIAPRTGAARVLFPGDNRGMNPNEVTMGAYLKGLGYATGCFGKWHLGDIPDSGPLKFGFDRYFGLPYSNDMDPMIVYRDEENVEEDIEKETDLMKDIDLKYQLIFDNMGKLKNNEEIWMKRLEEVKKYINENKKKPSQHNKNKEIKSFGNWINQQQQNYKNKSNIMKSEEIYNQWYNFINDDTAYDNVMEIYDDFTKAFKLASKDGLVLFT